MNRIVAIRKYVTSYSYDGHFLFDGAVAVIVFAHQIWSHKIE